MAQVVNADATSTFGAFTQVAVAAVVVEADATSTLAAFSQVARAIAGEGNAEAISTLAAFSQVAMCETVPVVVTSGLLLYQIDTGLIVWRL
jgi:hypothetical protein